MQSLFKLLDSYSREDQDIFFGRDEEVAQLYEVFHSSRLLLIYGASGTGKSSLVQAGLLAKLSASDWFPIFIKRGFDINQSIREELRINLSSPTEIEEIPAMISQLYQEGLRSIILIIDRLEELLSLGDREEQETFYHLISELQEPAIPCSVILIMREEYMGALTEMERVLPNVLNNRIRIEEMSHARSAQVILNTCERFNMRFEDPERGIPSILDEIGDGRGRISLPYLQVYLDRLYREGYARTYPNSQAIDPLNPIEITIAEIEQLGSIENIVGSFLDDQIDIIERKLQSTHKHVGSQSVLRVLSVFINFDGSRRTVGREEIEYSLHRGANLSEELLKLILTELSMSRIIWQLEDFKWELAHDSLTDQIYQKLSQEERQRRKIEQFVRELLNRYETSGTLLTSDDLDYIRPYLNELSLSPEEQQFIMEGEKGLRNSKKRRVIIFFIILVLFFLVFTLFYRAETVLKHTQEQTELLYDSLKSQQVVIDSLSNLLK